MGDLPAGFIYVPDIVTPEEERELIERVQAIELHEFQMHGVTAKRRIAHFGWRYSFDSRGVIPAEPMPESFVQIRSRAADLAGIDPTQFAETLVTEYKPGAGI